MPYLQDGIGLANQKAQCDQLLMSVCRGEMSLGHMLPTDCFIPRYTVMSGTPEKILELLLEAMRPDSSAHDPTGSFRRLSLFSESSGGHCSLTSAGSRLVHTGSWQEVLFAWVERTVTGAGHCFLCLC